MTRKTLFLLLLLAAACVLSATGTASNTSTKTPSSITSIAPVPLAEAPASDPMDAGNRAVIQYLDALKQTEAAQIAAGAGTAEAAVPRSTVSTAPDSTRKGSGLTESGDSPSPAVSSDSDPGAFLACVRQRESHGDYGAVNSSSGSAGAYQFLTGTWNNTAVHAGRPDLVGVNPANASPADQDAMAQALYAWQGTSPWAGPGC